MIRRCVVNERSPLSGKNKSEADCGVDVMPSTLFL